MGLDDLMKNKHHGKFSHHHNDEHDHEGYHDRYDHHDDHIFRHMDYGHGGHHHSNYKLELISSILRSLPHKKALLAGAAIVFLVIIIVGIVLLWAMFPLITQAVGYVEENGIKGIVDGVLPYLDKLWQGNK